VELLTHVAHACKEVKFPVPPGSITFVIVVWEKAIEVNNKNIVKSFFIV
jgi:hypothetical protein